MTMHSTDITLLFLEHKTLYERMQTSLMQFCKSGNCMESFSYFFPEVLQRLKGYKVVPLTQSYGVFRCRKANSVANCSVEVGWLEGVKVSLSPIFHLPLQIQPKPAADAVWKLLCKHSMLLRAVIHIMSIQTKQTHPVELQGLCFLLMSPDNGPLTWNTDKQRCMRSIPARVHTQSWLHNQKLNPLLPSTEIQAASPSNSSSSS